MPQTNAGISKNESKKLRFQWEKNDSLDVDTYLTLNFAEKLSQFYRLELLDKNTGIVIILKNNINHSDYDNDNKIWVDIDLQNIEFPFYYDSLGYESQTESRRLPGYHLEPVLRSHLTGHNK